MSAKDLSSDQLLSFARETIEVVFLRTTLNSIEYGPHVVDVQRLQKLSSAIELLDDCRKVVVL